MKKIILLFFVLSFSASIFAQNVNITFELNAATLSGNIDPAGLYVAGGSAFGVPGDNQLTDPDGDGIYTITIQKPVNTSSYYTFLNGNCGDWSCKENIAGLPCANPANYNDRWLPAVTQDTTIKACFGTCDSDGSCTFVTDSVEITFELNTQTIATIDPAGIFLAGGGIFGTPGDNPMADPDGDGVYTITVTKAKGILGTYTFLNGNCGDWSCKEDLAGLPCADPNAFNDRILPAIYSDTTIKACFGDCMSDGSCAVSTNRLEVDENLFSIQPTLATSFVQLTFNNAIQEEKQLFVMNAIGQTVMTTTSAFDANLQLDIAHLSNGIYFITVNAGEKRLTKKFVVAK